MYKLRLVALAGVVAATLLLTLLATGVAGASGDSGAPPATSACDVTGFWGGPFVGMLPANQGTVVFQITNQQQGGGGGDNGDDNGDDDNGDDDNGDDDNGGDDNGGDDNGDDDDNGDNGGTTSGFQWHTIVVSNGAQASGTGTIRMTSPTTAMFFISGGGTHPLAGGMPPDFAEGSFTVTAEGDLACAGGQGVAVTDGTFHVEFENGMTDDGFVGPLVGCTTPEGCGQQSAKGTGRFTDGFQRFAFDFQATSGPEGEDATGHVFLQNLSSPDPPFTGTVYCLEVNGEFAVVGAAEGTRRVLLAVEDVATPGAGEDLIRAFDVHLAEPECGGFEVFGDIPIDEGEIEVQDDAS